MCGIAGLVTADGAAPPDIYLQRLAGALAHRGPDGQGFHSAGGIGMVHRRLAIIDLETGDQPIATPNGTTLVANAEIYNYRELGRELGDQPFRTQSDCEPVL